MTSNKDELDCYYAALGEGLTVGAFLERHTKIFGFVHAQSLTEDYRLGRGRAKKLRDEVAPVARFAKANAKPTDQIRFALDNSYPDCVIRHEGGRERGIEVTVGHARKRLFLMSELNEKGTGRGFIDVPEDASNKQFEDAIKSEPEAFSTEQVINCIHHDLALRAGKKKWHRGDTLLVEVDLEPLPAGRWKQFLARFEENVQELSFREVYLTGRRDDGDAALRIK